MIAEEQRHPLTPGETSLQVPDEACDLGRVEKLERPRLLAGNQLTAGKGGRAAVGQADAAFGSGLRPRLIGIFYGARIRQASRHSTTGLMNISLVIHFGTARYVDGRAGRFPGSTKV